jgi:hypothetical protein
MGYALEIDDDITPADLFSNQDFYGKPVAEVYDIFWGILKNWLNKEEYYLSNWDYIDAHDSRIHANWYRVSCELSIKYADDNSNANIFEAGDELVFHWIYQTNTGSWVQKLGADGAVSYAALTPAQLAGTNKVKFIQIRDIYEIDW